MAGREHTEPSDSEPQAAPSAMHGQRHLQRGALSATLLPRTTLGGTASLQRTVVQWTFNYANVILMHVRG